MRCARSDRVCGLGAHCDQEELDPRQSFAAFADRLEGLVVALAVALQICAQVEQRRGQPATIDEQEDGQQAADAAVAVEKGVQRLELVVQQRVLHQQGDIELRVRVALPVGQQAGKLLRRRRDEARCLDRRTGGSYPVLGGAKLTGHPLPAAYPGKQAPVHLADQAHAKRQLVHLTEAPLEGLDVVDDLLDVGAGRLVARLGLEDIRQRRLRALDTRGGERLAQEIRANQQVWIRHQLADAGKPPERCLGVREQPNRRRGQLYRARYRRGEVCDVSVAADRAPWLPKRGRCVVAELHDHTLASLTQKAKSVRDGRDCITHT